MFSSNPLYFCGVRCCFFSFISDFIYLGPPSLLLDSCYRFINLNLFQQRTLGFIDLLYCSCGFYFVFFPHCNHCYSLFSTHIGLAFCFFSSFFRWMLRLLSCSFLFLEVGLYCCDFPSQDCFCCVP